MEKILTKYFWIFNIAALTLVAFFLAQGTGEIAAVSIEKLLPQKKTDITKSVRQANRPKTTDGPPPMGDAILSRNIFDSATGPIERHPEDSYDDESDENGFVIDRKSVV